MKKVFLALIIAIIALSMCACGVAKENVEIIYGDTYTVTNENLSKYDSIVWESSDTGIATVVNGNITAVAPGETVITALNNDKVVAEFSVNVKTIPVTSIVLSTNSHEMTEGETFQLSYTLFPENASTYGLSWKSADNSVAEVDQNGLIKALKPGQTTISISNTDGFIATCSVTVNLKPAYERLSAQEKAFVDCCLEHIGQFKNPDSVVVKEIQKDGSTWIVKVSAQNGFGGNNTTVYYLGNSGFWNWDSFDLDIDVDITADKSFNISLINEAIAEKR